METINVFLYTNGVIVITRKADYIKFHQQQKSETEKLYIRDVNGKGVG